MAKFSDFLAAITTLKAMPEAELQTALKDAGLIAKADLGHAQGLSAGEVVGDHWKEGMMHRGAVREEIKTGPSEASSGGGAERMVRDYSNPAMQHGTTLTAETLVHIMEPVAAASKAQTEAIRGLVTTVTALAASLTPTAKAEEDEDDEDDDEEEDESEVVEIDAAKAATLMSHSPVVNRLLVKAMVAQAKALIAKAAKMRGKASEMKDEDRKACKKAARELTKKAAAILGKALSIVHKSESLSKAHFDTTILSVALKADINVTQEEEEDEEEEDEDEAKAKSDIKSVAVKAKKPAKGNQADKMDPATGNQDDSAMKAIIQKQEELDKALSGLGMLSTDVRGMFDTIMGRSRSSEIVPVIGKSEAAVGATGELTEARFNELHRSGELNDADHMAAMDILSKAQAVREGVLAQSVLDNRIERTSTVVKALFGRRAA